MAAIEAYRLTAYSSAHPRRWSGVTRNWTPIVEVTLSPERDDVVKARLGCIDTQPQAA